MNFTFTSINSSKLSKEQIKLICELKNKHWKFGIKSQVSWYNKNIKQKDIHNLFFIKSKLIGYTCLRKRTCIIKKNMGGVISKYLYFDSFILNKKFRKKKLSNLMMNLNNMVIKQLGYFSFLICKYELLNFYQKHGWNKLKNKSILVKDHSFSTYGMIFNDENHTKKNYHFFLNR